MIKKLIQKIRKTPKKVLVISVLAVGVLLPVTAFAAWGPSRPTFDYNDPVERNGSLNGPVFNSFVNVPSYGDERNFVTVSDAGTGQWRETVEATPGEEVEVRVYVHNNANQDTNEDGTGVAKNTRVRVYIPEGTANGFDVAGYVSADNATPARVYDTGLIKNDNQAFDLEYVPGSAKIYNESAWSGGVSLPDSVVSEEGAQIGYDQLNGDLPGCFEYRAIVTVKMKVTAPELAFEKQVATEDSGWQERVTAEQGETVAWLLDYKNTGSAQMDDITLRDELPSNVELVPGSVTLYDSNNPDGYQLSDAGLFSEGGVKVGNYGPDGGGYIRFKTVVTDPDDECLATNVAFAYASNVPEQTSQAEVVRENCNPVEPVYSCDALSAVALGERKFEYTVAYTAENAELTNINYDFGDGNDLLTDETTVMHQYESDGEYTVRATLTFIVNGEEVTASGDNCMVTISAETPAEHCPIPGKEHLPIDSPKCKDKPPVNPPTTTVTTTPTVLPDTGPGDMIVFVVAVSAGASAAFQYVQRRS